MKKYRVTFKIQMEGVDKTAEPSVKAVIEAEGGNKKMVINRAWTIVNCVIPIKCVKTVESVEEVKE